MKLSVLVFLLQFCTALADKAGPNHPNILELYDKCDLSFFVLVGKKKSDSSSYFDEMVKNHTYTPRLLNIAFWDRRTIYFVKILWQNRAYPRFNGASMSRCLTVWVDPAQLNLQSIGKYPMTFFMLSKTIYFFNPHYIIGHVQNPKDSSYYTKYSFHTRHAKLLIWNKKNPQQIYIPCISCPGSHSPVNFCDITSLLDIEWRWKLANKNMNKQILPSVDEKMLVYVGNKLSFSCGPNLVFFLSPKESAYC